MFFLMTNLKTVIHFGLSYLDKCDFDGLHKPLIRLYSENKTCHWLLNNNSNNSQHFLTLCYCMFVYGWSVLGLRPGLFILSF